jgi:hypothetical protein
MAAGLPPRRTGRMLPTSLPRRSSSAPLLHRASAVLAATPEAGRAWGGAAAAAERESAARQPGRAEHRQCNSLLAALEAKRLSFQICRPSSRSKLGQSSAPRPDPAAIIPPLFHQDIGVIECAPVAIGIS